MMVEHNQSANHPAGVGYDNKFKFNGKELDDATKMYYYGARYGVYAERSWSNPRISIFVSVDPLAEKYPNKMPYHYVSNNPIMRIDPTGMEDGPGDRFSTLREAAVDFGKTYNDNSIKDNKEYGTRIYEGKMKSGEVYYFYNEPNIGKEAGVTVYPNASVDEKMVAIAHTHGSYSPKYKNDVPSSTDKDTSKMAYIATPNGAMLEYNPKTKETIQISTAIPGDVNHPMRLNRIDSESLPKDEPTAGVGSLLLNNIVIPLLKGSESIKN